MPEPSDLRSLRAGAFERLAALGRPYAGSPASPDRWAPVPAELDARIAADEELRAAAVAARAWLALDLAARLGEIDSSLVDAVITVPRERFVLPSDVARSADDVPLSLDPSGRATVSAPHAYVLTYRLLELAPGDHVLELGTGTGYGASLAHAVVGPAGRVTTIEIDRALCERARRLLAPLDPSIELLLGTGRARAVEVLTRDDPPRKIAVTFALSEVSADLDAAIPEGGTLVAPVGPAEDHQELLRVRRRGGVLERSSHGAVRYVPDRSR